MHLGSMPDPFDLPFSPEFTASLAAGEAIVRCFACAAPRKLNELAPCLSCGALLCEGRFVPGCSGSCLCQELDTLDPDGVPGPPGPSRPLDKTRDHGR